MARIIGFSVCCLLGICCRQPASNTAVINTSIDSTRNATAAEKNIDSMGGNQIDTALIMQLSIKILKAAKTKDYKKLVTFIDTATGIRFSPHAFIDTVHDRKFSAAEMLIVAQQKKRINWYSSLESSEPELLTIDEYFEKYIYDVDFLNAEKKSVNKFHSQSTEINNITAVYPDGVITEFFFSGFDKKYGGMDYRGLRLVFKKRQRKFYLVGVVHDKWTP